MGLFRKKPLPVEPSPALAEAMATIERTLCDAHERAERTLQRLKQLDPGPQEGCK